MTDTALVPLMDLKAQYQNLKPELDAAIQRVVTSGDFVMGEDVMALEQEFARFCGVEYAIAVGSGSDAVFLALLACGVNARDEVITVPNTCISTTSAITHTGAHFSWVDIDPKSLNIDPASIEAKITSRTRAILPVHMYGHPADMEAVNRLASKHKLIVVEDAALATGARYKGRRVGAWGDMGCFSFHPVKLLGAWGDAGMVVTNSHTLASKVRLLRSYGQAPSMNPRSKQGYGDQTTEWSLEGYNSRVDSMQAAVLRVKLKHLDAWLDKRRQIAKWYRESLAGADVILPSEGGEIEHAYHAFAVRVKDRERIQHRLNGEGIASRIYYHPPLHLQPVYKGLGFTKGDFPITEAISEEILCLPIYPELTESQVRRVAECLKSAVSAGG